MKKITRTIIDAVMSVLIIVLMAYQITGRQLHEYIGAAMLVLFIAHTVLNIRWYAGLSKGRYTPQRIWHTAVNLCLLVCILLLGYSGMTMSQYAFAFLPSWGGTATARTIHLAASYWCYLFICLHIGNHWGMMTARMKKLPKAAVIVSRIIVYVLAVLGAAAFAEQELWSYMLLLNKFVFFDESKSPLLFFAEYICIMILFVCAGYYISKLLGIAAKKRKEHKDA